MEQLLPQLPPSVHSLSISLQSGQQRAFKAAAARQPAAPRPEQGAGAAAAARQSTPLRLLQQRAHLESLLTLDLADDEVAEVAVGLPAPLPNLSGLTRLTVKGMDLTGGRPWHWLRSLSALQVDSPRGALVPVLGLHGGAGASQAALPPGCIWRWGGPAWVWPWLGVLQCSTVAT
jgi:hypothetical protein